MSAKFPHFSVHLILCALTAAMCIAGCREDRLDAICTSAGTEVQRILDRPDSYAVEISLSEIHRGKHPNLKRWSLTSGVEVAEYSAGGIQLPLAILTMEKLHALGIKWKDQGVRIRIDSIRPGQHPLLRDREAPGGVPTVDGILKRALLSSDPVSGDRLYDFLGPDAIQEALEKHGLRHTAIVRRSSDASLSQGRAISPLMLFHQDTLVYQQDEILAKGPFPPGDTHNSFPLTEQVRLMELLVFPEHFEDSMAICIAPDDLTHWLLWARETGEDSASSLHGLTSSAKGWFLHNAHAGAGSLRDCMYLVDLSCGAEYVLGVQISYKGEDREGLTGFEADAEAFMDALSRAVYGSQCTGGESRHEDMPFWLRTLFLNR